jgi:hypothetical protein
MPKITYKQHKKDCHYFRQGLLRSLTKGEQTLGDLARLLDIHRGTPYKWDTTGSFPKGKGFVKSIGKYFGVNFRRFIIAEENLIQEAPPAQRN